MHTRRLGRLLGGAALALILAGCFKVNMDVEVAPDNTVSGSAVVAVDESLLELSGQSADQLLAQMDLSELPEGATSSEYRQDGFIGQEITFADMTLEEFSTDSTLSGSQAGEDLNIVRQGDEFHVSGGFDMSGEEFTGSEIPQQFFDSFEFRISMTFPGEVKSSSGDIDGNTVTWEPKFGENTQIQAVASAIPSSSGFPVFMVVLIAAGALVLGAIAFLLTHRKAALAPAGPLGFEGGTPLEGTPPVMAEGPVGPVPPLEPPPAADPPGTEGAPDQGGVPPPPPPRPGTP